MEKRQEKAARKARRLAAAAEARASREAGIDPDLVGIRPGPQPVEEDPLDRREPEEREEREERED